jgi:hypothetical protein
MILDQIRECLFCQQSLTQYSTNYLHCANCQFSKKSIWLHQSPPNAFLTSLHIKYDQYQLNWFLEHNLTDFGSRLDVDDHYRSIKIFPYLLEVEYNETSIQQVFERCQKLLLFI